MMRHDSEGESREIQVQATGVSLIGFLNVPPDAVGVVVFAHGSGSGRFSPRNQLVARSLVDSGLATVLVDLLAETEALDRRKVFDIELLADRLCAISDWLEREPRTRDLPVGYFGASTGGGAALLAAALRPDRIRAVVSRGGRPDLAKDHLANVRAPTLLIVGGLDHEVRSLNQSAYECLTCPRDLVVVPGASHLFSEPGTLDEVARLAGVWFLRHLRPSDGNPC